MLAGHDSCHLTLGLSHMRSAPLTVGEPAPWFRLPTTTKERFTFDTLGGRHIVLMLFATAASTTTIRMLQAVRVLRPRFNDTTLSFFGMTTDREDVQLGRLRDQLPGVRFFLDADGDVTRRFGARAADGSHRPMTVVLDPSLRVLAQLDWTEDAAAHVAALAAVLDTLAEPVPAHPAEPQAPVLVVPRIFDAALCRALIDTYHTQGGVDSGFMRDIDGRTTTVIDHGFKRRGDCMIADAALQDACMASIRLRLVPEVYKAFQFSATHMERMLVSCYDAETHGHFRPHRDNTTKATRHRRFAVSLFLNTGEFEGGQLRFPEFGNALYGAPTGGAVVFSCSLLHEATAVTRGRRYMFLPFLYDDAGHQTRAETAQYLSDKILDLGQR